MIPPVGDDPNSLAIAATKGVLRAMAWLFFAYIDALSWVYDRTIGRGSQR